MSKPPDDINKVVIDALEKYLKVICYLVLINASFDIIITLPPEIANRIFDAIFRKLGL
jgi:hypothetical protein